MLLRFSYYFKVIRYAVNTILINEHVKKLNPEVTVYCIVLKYF